MRNAVGVFTKITGDVSVSPYPSRIGSPAAKKNLLISGASGAPPDTKYRSRPPVRALSFPNTSVCAIAYWTPSNPPESMRPARAFRLPIGRRRRATRRKMRFLRAPPDGSTTLQHACVHLFVETRRRRDRTSAAPRPGSPARCRSTRRTRSTCRCSRTDSRPAARRCATAAGTRARCRRRERRPSRERPRHWSRCCRATASRLWAARWCPRCRSASRDRPAGA